MTIRSRCRVLALRTPSADGDRGGAGPPGRHRSGRRRSWAASVARRPCRSGPAAGPDQEAREQRRRILAVPGRAAFGSATCSSRPVDLLAAAKGEATSMSERRDAVELEELKTALGAGGTGKGAVGAARGIGRGGQGDGAPAEVAGHPDRARRAGPRAGRPVRLLPRRHRPQSGFDRAADEPGRRREHRRGGRPAGLGRARCTASTRCSPAGRRSSSNVKPQIAVESMMMALFAGPVRVWR